MPNYPFPTVFQVAEQVRAMLKNATGLEDVFGASEQVNLPTTTGERYPNWRRKLPLDLESYTSDGQFAAVCAAIRAEGRGARQATRVHVP